ncbi:uncharacterized protein LOC143369914 isoform X2 [Andrena cerasifolii]|uniref:uncharacterized protein LOC143369914 isoform X2 n=1 Tax=Andrena cerasifolii TaxID=2819439 RepID=UPI0040379698
MATRIKMEHVQSDIDPQIVNTSKAATRFIEWNVDMNVTVSNVKKSKVFQRSRGIILFLFMIALAVVLSHLRREVRALQVQVQSVNVNLLLLMSKYDRLNRSLNRAWMHRSGKFLEKRNVDDARRILDGASPSVLRDLERLDGTRDAANGNSYAYVTPHFGPVGSSKEDGNLTAISKQSLINLEENQSLGEMDEANLRIERAILTVEKQNATERSGTRSDQGKDADDDNDGDYDVDDLDIWRGPRSGRSRRDEGRGPLVATFVGAIPEQHVTDTFYIGPWVKSAKNNTQYSLNKFHLVEDKKSIEVTTTGLYMISVQIFYFGEPTNYSYWILLSSEGKSATQKLVKCSTASSVSATEVSCYTSVITPLQRGDRVHIQQQERNRLINMREGHSYVQLVLLSNTRKWRQR